MGWGVLGRWIFARTVGDKVTADVIKKYIRFHEAKKRQAEQLKMFQKARPEGRGSLLAPFLTDFELHLFAEGTFFKAYETMGAHLRTVRGIAGVYFVIWAPTAARVSVVGNFNQWDGRRRRARASLRPR